MLLSLYEMIMYILYERLFNKILNKSQNFSDTNHKLVVSFAAVVVAVIVAFECHKIIKFV